VDATEFDPGKGLIYFSGGCDVTTVVFHENTPGADTLVENV
jgi:hypothetical protein